MIIQNYKKLERLKMKKHFSLKIFKKFNKNNQEQKAKNYHRERNRRALKYYKKKNQIMISNKSDKSLNINHHHQ